MHNKKRATVVSMLSSFIPWPKDSPRSIVDDPLLEIKPKVPDLSYHEIYQIYKPSQKLCRDALRLLEARREDIRNERQAVQNRLLQSVRYADIDFAVQLVGSARWDRELAQIEDLAQLNEFILRRSSADEVKNIPVTDFIKFDRAGFARCPFHKDKKPSLKYYPKQNRAHCFSGCGQKNVVQIYAVLNGVSDRDAYIALKERL